MLYLRPLDEYGAQLLEGSFAPLTKIYLAVNRSCHWAIKRLLRAWIYVLVCDLRSAFHEHLFKYFHLPSQARSDLLTDSSQTTNDLGGRTFNIWRIHFLYKVSDRDSRLFNDVYPCRGLRGLHRLLAQRYNVELDRYSSSHHSLSQ